MPAEMHLSPGEVRLAASEMLVPAEMHLTPNAVHANFCRNSLEA
jgi:hypothetical protein